MAAATAAEVEGRARDLMETSQTKHTRAQSLSPPSRALALPVQLGVGASQFVAVRRHFGGHSASAGSGGGGGGGGAKAAASRELSSNGTVAAPAARRRPTDWERPLGATRRQAELPPSLARARPLAAPPRPSCLPRRPAQFVPPARPAAIS